MHSNVQNLNNPLITARNIIRNSPIQIKILIKRNNRINNQPPFIASSSLLKSSHKKIRGTPQRVNKYTTKRIIAQTFEVYMVWIVRLIKPVKHKLDQSINKTHMNRTLSEERIYQKENR